VKRVAETLAVARSNLLARAAPDRPRQPRGRRPQPEAELLAEIRALIAGQPTYGYRRIHALLRRQRREQGGAAVNVKRLYRVMKANGLLLERPTGTGEERRHDGRVAVDRPDTRWCSDGFEIGCETASGFASPSPSTAATARRSPGSRRPAASRAVTSAT
jgi:putative transposase